MSNPRAHSIHELKPEQLPLLADAQGDGPETLQSVHVLRRNLCRAYIAGDPARFDAHTPGWGAIIQSQEWPEEPTGFGADAGLLWSLLQMVEGWTCLLVDSACAPALAQIMSSELRQPLRTLEDITHLLTKPAPDYRHPAVRRLTLADLDLLEATPLELRSGLWASPRQMIEEGIVACAIVADQIVATALVTALSPRYAEIGVYTLGTHRRQGYATAAASLVARAIQAMGRIPLWGAGAHNAASLRLARKLGFVEVSRRTYLILDT
jgi:RimJ/RimL family protein N-acetyltransferase